MDFVGALLDQTHQFDVGIAGSFWRVWTRKAAPRRSAVRVLGRVCGGPTSRPPSRRRPTLDRRRVARSRRPVAVPVTDGPRSGTRRSISYFDLDEIPASRSCRWQTAVGDCAAARIEGSLLLQDCELGILFRHMQRGKCRAAVNINYAHHDALSRDLFSRSIYLIGYTRYTADLRGKQANCLYIFILRLSVICFTIRRSPLIEASPPTRPT